MACPPGFILLTKWTKEFDPLAGHFKGVSVNNASLYQSDAECVRLAQQGDIEAFAALFDVHKARIYSLCLRMVGNKAEAEELTQTTFLQVFRKLANFREDTDFSVWIYRVAVDTIVERQRKSRLTPLSVEPLVKLARESVFSPASHARFRRVRAGIRNAHLHLSTNYSWTSVFNRFGRQRSAA